MRIGILYFSGTGVTGYVTRTVAGELENLGHRVVPVRYRSGISFDPEVYDVIGVGAPAYSFYPPRVFVRFLRTLPKLNGKPFFLINTSHHLQGLTVRRLYTVLKRKGWRLVAQPLLIRGVNNIRSWRFKKVDSRPRDRLAGMEGIEPFAAAVSAGGVLESGDGTAAVLRSRPGLAVFTALFTYSWMMALVEGYRKRIDRDRCTSCMICVDRLCPSEAIFRDEVTGLPKINNLKCIGCSSCINLCPVEAVVTGSSAKRWPLTKYKEYL